MSRIWKGGQAAALPFAFACALTLVAMLVLTITPASAAEQAVPWGAGCTSAPPGSVRTSDSCGAALIEGDAVAPLRAPVAVKAVVAAANEIDGRPYVWGGGHTSWSAKGYDCSGAVSYSLHGGGLLDVTMVSGQLASWGVAGKGRWLTVYANSKHVFMVVAGLRFDTRNDPPGVSGPRWHMARVDPPNFVVRHPAGL